MAVVLTFLVTLLIKGISTQICTNYPPLPTTTSVFPLPTITNSMPDSSVTQALTNTLQLLVVSNLLGNTLNAPPTCKCLQPIAPAYTLCDPPCPSKRLSCGCDALVLPEPPCGCRQPSILPNLELILPPPFVELPCGLGYLPEAVPLVTSVYDVLNPLPCEVSKANPATAYCYCSRNIPVTGPCCSPVLATPLPLEIEGLAYPIIL